MGAIIKFILAVVLFVYPALNFMGFCVHTFRWLSYDERIGIAVQMLNAQPNVSFQVEEGGDKHYVVKTYKNVPYPSIEEFYKANPDCCRVNPGGPYYIPESTIMDKLTGNDSGQVVVINYIARYIDELGREQYHRIRNDSVQTNCGAYLQ